VRHQFICAALGAVAVSLLAACSTTSGTPAPSPAQSPAPSEAASPTPSAAEGGSSSQGSTGSAATKFPLRKGGVLVAVALRKVPGEAAVHLVDGFGAALYLFDADQNGKSVCNEGCTKVWSPVKATSTDIAGGGARGDLIGSTIRDDGAKQLTYNDHPLYYYVGTADKTDTDDGVAHGVGGGWWTVNGNGDPIMTS
jgi:predicted lipoprotein with Yx(FWY)xxD motif